MVKSAERVLIILEHLLGFPNGLTAKEISIQLGIYRIADSFSGNRFVRKKKMQIPSKAVVKK